MAIVEQKWNGSEVSFGDDGRAEIRSEYVIRDTNDEFVAEAAGPALAGVIVDGAAIPRMSGQLPACVVQRWGSLLGLQYPDDWDERVGDDEPTNLSGLYRYAADRYPDVEFVLVTNRDDPRMQRLLRAGAGACNPAPADVRPDGFGRGVDALEADLASLPTWSTVVVDGSGSTPIAVADGVKALASLGVSDFLVFNLPALEKTPQFALLRPEAAQALE